MREEREEEKERFLGSLEVVKRTKEERLARSGKGEKKNRTPLCVHEKIIGDSRELLQFCYQITKDLQCLFGGFSIGSICFCQKKKKNSMCGWWCYFC